MLKSIGKSPTLYYDESDYYQNNYNNNGQNNNGNDDGSYNVVEPSNAECVPYYGTDVADDDDYYNGNDDQEAENDQAEEEEANRQLSSNDYQNDVAYSSTLGCSSKGNYVIGVFKGGSCDGNYFQTAIDKFHGYNRQHKWVGCRALWNQGSNEVTYERTRELLSNSWTCDIRLYPNSCPDPYGVKGHYEYALRTAAHGGDPMRAYRQSVWRRPIRVMSGILLVVTAIVLLVTYNITNNKRIMARGGGWKVGLQCLKEDFLVQWGVFKVAAQGYWAKAREAAARRSAARRAAAQKRRAERSLSGSYPRSGRKKLRRKSSSRKSKSRSKSRGRSMDDDTEMDGESGVELGRVRRKSKSRKGERKSKSKSRRSKSRGDGEGRSSSRRGSRSRDQDEDDRDGGASPISFPSLEDNGYDGVMA